MSKLLITICSELIEVALTAVHSILDTFAFDLYRLDAATDALSMRVTTSLNSDLRHLLFSKLAQSGNWFAPHKASRVSHLLIGHLALHFNTYCFADG